MIAEPNRTAEPPVLIDTPVWQAYFRKEEAVFARVNALMDGGRVCSLAFIVAELVAEASTEEEIKAFRGFPRIFPILREPENAWIEAAARVASLKKRGAEISLRDAYVAWSAKKHGVPLWTRSPVFSPSGKTLLPGLKKYAERRGHA